MSRIAVCIFKYFPYGGLERDCLQIAQECQRRGYQIRVYTFDWQGAVPEGFEIIKVSRKAMTSHANAKFFSNFVKNDLRLKPVDLVFGVNRIEGLDVYFAGDNCIKEKGYSERGFLYRLTPRYKCFCKLEQALFDKQLDTQILYLAERQKREYQKHYGIQNCRFHLMPAGISVERRRPANATQIRSEVRKSFNFSDNHRVLIEVGSGYFRKGVNRVMIAIASLPEKLREQTFYMPVGYESRIDHFKQLANKLGVNRQILFLGGRKDVSSLLLGADLMVHPALDEATGTVLIESLAAGVPVMCSATCGYASYIEQAKAGIVLPEPFNQEVMNKELERLLSGSDIPQMSKNALAYANSHEAEIFSRPQKAADIIEGVIRKKIKIKTKNIL